MDTDPIDAELRAIADAVNNHQLEGPSERLEDLVRVLRASPLTPTSSRQLRSAGRILLAMGHWQSSLKIFEELRNALPKDAPASERAVSLADAALAYTKLQRSDLSMPLARAAMDLRHEVSAAQWTELADALADCFHTAGDYATARGLYEQVLSARPHPLTLSNLGQLEFDAGDLTQAASYFWAAQNWVQQVVSRDDPYSAMIDTGLGRVWAALGRPDYAVLETGRAVDRLRAASGNAPERRLSIALTDLGQQMLAAGRLAEAEQLLLESVWMKQQLDDGPTVELAASLGSLAEVEEATGHFAQSVHHFSQAYACARHARDGAGMAHFQMGLARARHREDPSTANLVAVLQALTQPALDSSNWHRATMYAAEALLAEGDSATAVEIARPILTSRPNPHTLALLSERQFLDRGSKETRLIGLLMTLAVERWDDAHVVQNVFEVVQTHHSRLLGEDAENRRLARHLKPELADLFRTLNDLRRALSECSFAAFVGDAGAVEESAALREQIDFVDSEVGRFADLIVKHSLPDSQSTITDELRGKLGDGECYVHFVRYSHLSAEPRHHYAAFVLRGGTSEVRVVPLGSADEIDELARGMEVCLAGRDLIPAGGWQRTEDSSTIGRRLHEKIIAPLPFVDTAVGWFVVADGHLARLPLAAIATPTGGFLVDDHEITMLWGAKQLMEVSPPPRIRPPMVFALPDYDHGATGPTPSEAIHFKPLPGAADESRWVAEKLGVDRIPPEHANRDAFFVDGSPEIVHIATHGYFLDPEDDAAHGFDARHLIEPSLRSGLALSGANAFFADRRRHPRFGTGTLLSPDISGMDLTGTRVVNLSACKSGIGVVESLEGTFGVLRGFFQAGARSVIASLWAVPDEETSDLMRRFYDGMALPGVGPAAALRRAQQAMRHLPVNLWGAFVCYGSGAVARRSPEPARDLELPTRFHAINTYTVGRSYQALGDLPAALAAYDRAIELDPEFSMAYNNRGSVLQAQGHLEEALDAYRSAVELASGNTLARRNLAILLDKTGRGEDAAPHWAVLQEQTRRDPLVLRRRVDDLRGRGEFRAAKEAVEDWLKVGGRDDRAWATYGMVLGELGQKEAAITAFQNAASLNPDEPRHRLNVGLTMAQLGRLGEAEELVEEALTGLPELDGAWAALAMIQLDQGRADEALETIGQALLKVPESGLLTYRQGVILMELGRIAQARESFERSERAGFPGAGEAVRLIQEHTREKGL